MARRVTPAARAALEKRVERAERLRPLIARKVREVGPRTIAMAVGISEGALQGFLNGRTPYAWTLDAYEDWLESGSVRPARVDLKALGLRDRPVRLSSPAVPAERPRERPLPHEPLRGTPPARKERADRLRPIVAERVEALGRKTVAWTVGLSETAVQEFLRGRTPLAWALEEYERWLRQTGHWPSKERAAGEG